MNDQIDFDYRNRDTFASVMKDFLVTTVKSTLTNALNALASMVAVVSTVLTTSPVIVLQLVTKDTCVKSTLMNAVVTTLASVDDASTHRAVTIVCARVKTIVAVIVTEKIPAESSHLTLT